MYVLKLPALAGEKSSLDCPLRAVRRRSPCSFGVRTIDQRIARRGLRAGHARKHRLRRAITVAEAELLPAPARTQLVGSSPRVLGDRQRHHVRSRTSALE